MPGAVADAVAGAVERRQRHQHDVGNISPALGDGSRMPSGPRTAGRPEPGAKCSGCIARHDHRQRQLRALRGEPRINGVGSISLRIGE